MRARIKVADLTLRQWDFLQDHLPASYEIPDNAVRVCVEFELDPEIGARHVEMPVRAFVALMTRLQRIEHHGELEAMQTGTATLGKDPELEELPPKWSAPLSMEPGCGCTPERRSGETRPRAWCPAGWSRTRVDA